MGTEIRGGVCVGGGGEGTIPNVHCHHQDDSCIKRSYESQFIVLLIERVSK